MPYQIKDPGKDLYIMEFCGTHTMAIARAGLRQCLPSHVHLVSGPGCPVCVTPSGAIDTALQLAEEKNIMICSYGDMLRVPGSRQETLLQKKAAGADVHICLSAMDALQLAKRFPEKEVIFLGVGFETTAPGTAVSAKIAKEEGCRNFSIFNLLKRSTPAITAILDDPQCQIDAFLCPGHVAAIIGETGFSFLPKNYHKSAVVAGFEPEDILYAIQLLCEAHQQDRIIFKNTYTRLVQKNGNPHALALLEEVFEETDSVWRGLGNIERSAFGFRKEYERWDAVKKFHLPSFTDQEPAGCCCGEVIRGKKRPQDCPLFHRTCHAQNPIGPCMVSSEGTCAAADRYE